MSARSDQAGTPTSLSTGAISRLLPRSGVRSLPFHEVAPAPSRFTDGLGVTVSPTDFEARIEALRHNYRPIGLDEVLAAGRGEPGAADGSVLVTFHDAYGSVARVAAPMLRRLGVPAVFFVNGAFVDGAHLILDNLICYVRNTAGPGLRDAARKWAILRPRRSTVRPA